MATLDTEELEAKVQSMYRAVAEHPFETYHFETGRPVADHLGYDATILDGVPQGAVDSFAGVGFFFALAELRSGEWVVDLGSGSGMDVFYAAQQVGADGKVIGVDFTPEQLDKARGLATDFPQVEFLTGRIDDLPLDDGSVDCVISNGVINLSPRKDQVFAEAARVLRPGGRLAIADIVSEQQLTEAIVCDADLWASCIGGAAQEDSYRTAIEGAGLRVEAVQTNPYRFISRQALNASAKYGVKSVSVLAVKPA